MKIIRNRKNIWILTFLNILLAIAGCQSPKTAQDIVITEESTEQSQSPSTEQKQNSEETPVQDKIAVDVAGAVMTPGVYYVASDARVCDAIRAAGGFSEKAVPEQVNQARKLTDGEQIFIPDVDTQMLVEEMNAQKTEDGSSLVNLNQADKNSLMSIPGIGETRAEAILAYREEHGSFQSVEDLMNVSGIKEGMFQKISQYICVN